MDELTDLKSEIQCRIDYYRQLCNSRDIPLNLMDYYRGCADSLNSILLYTERGITEVPSEVPSDCPLDISEKVLKGKELKGKYIKEALKK